MKRITLEWGMLLSVGMAVTLSTLWVFTKFFDRSPYRLKVPHSQSAQGDLFLAVNNGDFALSDQYYVPASGNVRPLIVTAPLRARSGTLRGGRLGGFAIPGLDVRYYRFGPDGYLVWSLRLSMLILVVLFLMLTAWFRHRLEHFWNRTDRARIEPSLDGHEARA